MSRIEDFIAGFLARKGVLGDAGRPGGACDSRFKLGMKPSSIGFFGTIFRFFVLVFKALDDSIESP